LIKIYLTIKYSNICWMG